MQSARPHGALCRGGGELLEHIRRSGRFSEAQARFFVAEAGLTGQTYTGLLAGFLAKLSSSFVLVSSS